MPKISHAYGQDTSHGEGGLAYIRDEHFRVRGYLWAWYAHGYLCSTALKAKNPSPIIKEYLELRDRKREVEFVQNINVSVV